MPRFLTSYIIPLLAPVLLVFKHLFLGDLITAGDAPYFYAERLKGLIGEPMAWTERGLAFGGVNNLIWISPLMVLYGLIGSNDLAVRMIFYLPSLILATLGSYLFADYLGLTKKSRLFASLIYLLNTYFILLVDGGQVGVALAYGIFPLAILYLKKFLDAPSVKTFFTSLVLTFALSVADPRVAVICIAAAALWAAYEGKLKKLISLLPFGVALVGLSMYWLYPFFKNGIPAISGLSEGVGPKWYHPMTLLAPNWPGNIFGKISEFNPLFIGVPILIFIGVFLKKGKEAIVYALVFLTFGLLSSSIVPFEKIPLGFIFRDETKFFIPVVLFGAILIGRAVEIVKLFFFKFVVYGYLVFLIYPALTGNLNFILSGKQEKKDFQIIQENFKTEEGAFRTAWFPEKHPLAFETQEKPAVDGRDVVSFWPFAEMNVGEDPFNFLYDSAFADWFRILGIKYLVLSDNPRQVTKDASELRNWQEINNLVQESENLERQNWDTDIPIYKVSNVYPRFFAVKKLYAVVGTLPAGTRPLANAVFFEDGKLDPTLLEGKDAASAEIVFSGKDKTDLAMSFLQKYFVSVSEADKSQWATFGSSDYLKYKYELLMRGVEFDDFDYGSGVAFSTVSGEKMEYNFDVPEAGDYILAARSMSPDKGQIDMKWEITPISLAKGPHGVAIQNETGLSILNVVALIPKKDYEAALAKADVFTKHFEVVDINSLGRSVDYQKVELAKVGTLNYDFTVPMGYRWVILTENYHSLWKLRKGPEYLAGVPAFSMVNAFYVEDDWNDYGLVFTGQANVRWGIYWSVASALTLSVLYLRFLGKKDV